RSVGLPALAMARIESERAAQPAAAPLQAAPCSAILLPSKCAGRGDPPAIRKLRQGRRLSYHHGIVPNRARPNSSRQARAWSHYLALAFSKPVRSTSPFERDPK